MTRRFVFLAVATLVPLAAAAQSPQPYPYPTQDAQQQQPAQPQAQPAPPPSQPAPAPAPSAPASNTTVVNPPPAATAQSAPVVIQSDAPPPRRNPIATVALDAAYGGVAGLLIGTGVALIDGFEDNWKRDMSVGTGIGLVVGGLAGVGHAVYEAKSDEDARKRREERLGALGPPASFAKDGQGSTVRDPVLARRPAVAISGRW